MTKETYTKTKKERKSTVHVHGKQRTSTLSIASKILYRSKTFKNIDRNFAWE
jgi:hypothetical protein